MSVSPGSPLHVWSLGGGLTLAFERRHTAGFAFDLRLPLGSAHDPVGQEGALGVLEEWLHKGAGKYDARQLQDAFDDLGVRRGGGVGLEATRMQVSGLRADLEAALALVADTVQRPHLPAHEVPVLLDLARQDLESLDDSPTDLLALHARRVTFPRQAGDPGAGFAHPVSGTPEGLGRISAASLQLHAQRLGQAGSVLGIVADAEPDWVLDTVTRLFGGWQAGQAVTPSAPFFPVHFQPGVREHFCHPDAEQTHLSLVAPGPSPRDPDWLPWQVALAALSGGNASRLFVRVREERGLAYDVSATPLVLGGQGFVSLYAGSTPANAPETLDVLLGELARLGGGLSADEFRRARTALETGVVFGAESLRARATALTRDLTLLGRVRRPEEQRAALAALTLEQVNTFLATYAPQTGVAVVSLGRGEDAALAVSA